jgi:hypothetical protein
MTVYGENGRNPPPGEDNYLSFKYSTSPLPQLGQQFINSEIPSFSMVFGGKHSSQKKV